MVGNFVGPGLPLSLPAVQATERAVYFGAVFNPYRRWSDRKAGSYGAKNTINKGDIVPKASPTLSSTQDLV
jgi:hypothetical protein